MLTKETLSFLTRMKIVRGLSLPVALLPGTNRMPRFRVRIPPEAQDLLVGQTLADSYYVLSVLGYGGMSVVYKAKRLTKPRVFAIKTLRLQSLSDERTVKRFQREAELLLHLNHPRIVQVSFYGTTKRGQPYFVMDYLTGENLNSVFKNEAPLPPERVRDIFSQVCGAVDHAHRCGVVHRDLKPGNIMLMEQDGQKDFVKVVDFGIARFEEEAQRLTRMGEVWGSPVYMSPEQCMGSQLDVRSDIYSLGVVIFEALTGRVPHLGKNYVETMSMQIMSYPRPFFEVCPGRTFPPGLEKVVRKALEKEPDKRYQTMGELRADLEQVVPRPGKDGQPARTPEPRGTGNRLPGLPQTVAKLMDQAVNPSLNKKPKVVKGPLTGAPPKGRRPTGEDWEVGRISSGRNQSFRDSQSRIKHLQSAASKSSQSISLMIMIFAFAAMTVALIALATQLLGGLKGNSQLQLLDPDSTQTPLQQPQPQPQPQPQNPPQSQSPAQSPQPQAQSPNPPGEQPTSAPPQLLLDPSANPDQGNAQPPSASEGAGPQPTKGTGEKP